MEVLRPGDAGAFLRLAGPLLERDEARNQLPLGIAGTLTTHPDAYDVVHFWVVRDAGEPVAAAVRTEPFNLVLGDPSSEAALGPLLEAVSADDPEVPGIVGNVPFVEPAAERLAARERPERRAHPVPGRVRPDGRPGRREGAGRSPNGQRRGPRADPHLGARVRHRGDPRSR